MSKNPFSENKPWLTSNEVRAAYSLICRDLKKSTGTSDPDRRVGAAYGIATHSLPDPNLVMFPLLPVRGKPSSGKTQTMKIIGNACYRPRTITMSGTSFPKVRDFLANCRGATAILEEADNCMGSGQEKTALIEDALRGRYSRDTETGGIKVQVSDKSSNYTDKEIKIFGSTILHQRFPFKDAALNGRSIFLRLRPVKDRTFERFDEDDPFTKETRDLLSDRPLKFTKMPHVQGVADRIHDTWAPLLSVASLLEDEILNRHMVSMMRQATEDLQEGQGEEPDALICNIVMERVFSQVGEMRWEVIPVSYIHQTILKRQDPDSRKLTSYNIAKYLREMGFTLKQSGGQQRLHVTAETLIRAAEFCCMDGDSAIEELRNQIYPRNAEEKKEKTSTPKKDPSFHSIC